MNSVFTKIFFVFLFVLAACGGKKKEKHQPEPPIAPLAAACERQYQSSETGASVDLPKFISEKNGKWSLRGIELFQEYKESKHHVFLGSSVNFDSQFEATFVLGCSGGSKTAAADFSFSIYAEILTDRSLAKSVIEGRLLFEPQGNTVEQTVTRVESLSSLRLLESTEQRSVSAKKLDDNSLEVWISETVTDEFGVSRRTLSRASYIQVPNDPGDKDPDQEDEDRPGDPPSQGLLQKVKQYAETPRSSGGLGLSETESAEFVARFKNMKDWQAETYLEVHRDSFLFGISSNWDMGPQLTRKGAIALADLIAGKKKSKKALAKFINSFVAAFRSKEDYGLGLSSQEAYAYALRAIESF
ncbi:MAG: hypothetical protein AB7H97_00170 [Pseudobdellovibrionaceae bacterium]